MPVDDGEGFYPSPRRTPWPVFALAADAAVEHLSARFGLDLWMVTQVVDDQQVVVASAGHWAELARPGTAFCWADSFCVAMVERRGPMLAPDVLAVPAYAATATGVLARVRAYVGVPLEGDCGVLFGTLCAIAGTAQPEAPDDLLSAAELVAQMLSTILAHEQVALTRSEEAATAYSLAERDHRTGLLNPRGWQAVVRREDQRLERYGSYAGVLAATIERPGHVDDTGADPAGDDERERCAEVLAATSRPGDVLGQLAADEFVVLAIECDARCLKALEVKLRIDLRTAGVPVSTGAAARRVGEPLSATTDRARAAMASERRRRQARRT